ncbi:succinylglutamate-semialdehyde dehydrogenase [Pedomonas sp. V897]|uniref:succinylglutamate-semialdehyde dehydrogenase n=1 Tax=Pedomonas sp. V897 TaxID=3446482 RepID=UPI003EDEC8C7
MSPFDKTGAPAPRADQAGLDAGEILVSTNPATGEAVWRGTAATGAQVSAAIAAARSAFPDWARRPFEERAAIATTYAERMRERKEELARLIAQETGKPFWEALTEIDSVAAKVDISIRAYHERTGTRVQETGGMRQRVAHKPHGVLAVLGPYNFPMHLANGHIVPALLAGNTVVFKPSEETPACGLAMAEVWQEAGLPEDVLNVVVGAAATGRALAGHPDIDGLLFTGSMPTGLALHRQFAETPHKILALEMGGNNPLVVWGTGDAEAAAHVIAQSAFLSAGQRCTCARRLILPAGEEGNRVLDALVAVTERLIVGAPFDEPQPFMGPVINRNAARRLLAAQDGLLAAGGKPVKLMTRPVEARPFLTPGIIDITHVSTRADEEHFGPLLQVIRVTDFSAALDEANATRYGLAAGLISDDEALYTRFWAETRAGVLAWNRPTTGAASASPFGGVGLSGNHRPSAWYAADYCAFPVASLEQDTPGAPIRTGLRST